MFRNLALIITKIYVPLAIKLVIISQVIIYYLSVSGAIVAYQTLTDVVTCKYELRIHLCNFVYKI